jgi:hypothetical protein
MVLEKPTMSETRSLSPDRIEMIAQELLQPYPIIVSTYLESMRILEIKILIFHVHESVPSWYNMPSRAWYSGDGDHVS